jgi:hypothetical protein
MIATVAAILAVTLVPQGGQGGQGGFQLQGGAGGVVGQGNVGREMGTEQTFSHILTQGDKTEWPFKCKAGEVLILRASSDTFDPGVELRDSQGKLIGENDDEAEGMQNARLLVYIEKDGEYKAHVKNYRNAGGGRYDFSVRRFMTQTVTTEAPLTLTPNPENMYYIRILAPKGKLVSLHSSRGEFSRPIDSDGNVTPWRSVYRSELVNVFDAKKDAYYAWVGAAPTKDSPAVIRAVVAEEYTVERNQPRTTEPANSGVHVWKFKVKSGDFLKVHAKGSKALPTYFPPAVGNMAEGGVGFKIISSTHKWADSVPVMFTKDGDVEIIVPPSDAHRGYTFTLSEAWKPWDGFAPISSDLAIGSTMYYGFDAKPGYISRLMARARNFDLIYRMFDAHLNPMNTIDDDGENNMNASTTLSLPKGGRYYISISCFGSGGGGPYELNSTPIQPKSITMGVPIQEDLTSPLDGLWTLKIDKPQTLMVRLKTNGLGDVTLLDPAGEFVELQRVRVKDGDYMIVFPASKVGTYRIWRVWNGGKETYSMQVSPIDD